jgi:outer membrane immunogenic protein
MRLIRLAVAGMMAIGLGKSALAADLPSRSSPTAPPMMAPFSWTGAYFGLNGGYNWGTATGSYRISSATLEMLPPLIPTIDAAGSHQVRLQGGLFGFQFGFNWELANSFVFGVEGDFDWSGLSGSIYNAGIVPVAGGPYSISQRLKTDWLGTVRARAGLAPIDRLLVFATAGPAFTHIGYSSAFTDSFKENEDVSINTTRVGWAVGAGAEYAFAANWSAKLDYLHSEFGALSALGSTTLTDGTTAFVAHSTGVLKVDAVRVGLNYRFD